MEVPKKKNTLNTLFTYIIASLLCFVFALDSIGALVYSIDLISNMGQINYGGVGAVLLVSSLLELAGAIAIIVFILLSIKKVKENKMKADTLGILAGGIFFTVIGIGLLLPAFVASMQAGYIVLAILLILVGGFNLFVLFGNKLLQGKANLFGLITTGLNIIFSIVLMATVSNGGGMTLVAVIFLMLTYIFALVIDFLNLFVPHVLQKELSLNSGESNQEKTEEVKKETVEEVKEEVVEEQPASEEVKEDSTDTKSE